MDAETEAIVSLFLASAWRLGIEGSYLTGEPRFEPKQLGVLMRDLCDREVLAPLDPDALDRALEMLNAAKRGGR